MEEQAHHRLSNNKWAKENNRKNMNKLRYEIKAAEAKLACENGINQNARVLQSTLEAASSLGSRSFHFQGSSGTPRSVAPSRDRSGTLLFMPASVYRTILNPVAPRHVTPYSAPRRMTHGKLAGPNTKIFKRERIRRFNISTEDPFSHHPVAPMGPRPPRIAQDSGIHHKTNRPASCMCPHRARL